MEFYDKFEDMFQDLSKVKKSCFHLVEGYAEPRRENVVDVGKCNVLNHALLESS